MLSPKQIADAIYTKQNLTRIAEDKERYMIYNGRVRDTIKEAIQREFFLPETVRELIGRIIPLNIMQKIVNKLATVYKQEPRREPIDGNEADLTNLDSLISVFNLNHKMMQANRYFKLTKNVIIEPYVHLGIPKIRTLPSHTYTPLSDDLVEPENPTVFVKHISMGNQDQKEDVHVVWSETHHYTMNGVGEVIVDPNNPDVVNIYGVIPYVYVKESDDLIIPISDDDLMRMQIVICLLLTDLAFASKYQAWSIIALINASTEKLSFNPNSVISLQSQNGETPDIKVVKPELDSDALLRMVEALLGMLLTTKSLSVSTVTGQLQAANAASGVAKILDQSESTEDKEVQISYFTVAEKLLWGKLATSIYPVWVQTGQLAPEFASMALSQEFELAISFPSQKVVISEAEAVELEIKKLDNGLTTHHMAIQAINPEYTTEEVDQVLHEIAAEKKIEMQVIDEAANDGSQDQVIN